MTQEETSALEAAGIDDYILVEYSYDGQELNWTVSSLLYNSKRENESRFVGQDQVERNQLEQTIKESLSRVKQVIDNQENLGESEETFEI